MTPTRAAKRTHSQGFSPWPVFSDDEIAAAARVLTSGKINYWTGEEGRAFEREFAASAGARYAVALANGSLALEAALRALGIGAGDEVIVPSRSFVASASCVLMCGARPVFADVERESGNISAATIAPLISPRTRALIAVHLGGWPCEMRAITELARAHNLKVIEDCAQAQGGKYRGAPVGSFGDAAAFSFCQDKIMTTGGEGGMLVTSDENVYHRAWSCKDHGKNFETSEAHKPEPGFRWLHDSAGSNWRMTEMQSAMGRVMLPKIEARIAQRQKNAATLAREFSKIGGLRLVTPPAHISHACYRYYAYVRPEGLLTGWDRDRIQAAIMAEDVPCSVGSCGEVYLEKAFADCRPAKRLPAAKELAETSLAFLVHPTLTEDDLQKTVATVAKVMRQASR